MECATAPSCDARCIPHTRHKKCSTVSTPSLLKAFLTRRCALVRETSTSRLGRQQRKTARRLNVWPGLSAGLSDGFAITQKLFVRFTFAKSALSGGELKRRFAIYTLFANNL